MSYRNGSAANHQPPHPPQYEPSRLSIEGSRHDEYGDNDEESRTLGSMILKTENFTSPFYDAEDYDTTRLGYFPGMGLEFWDLSYAVTKEAKRDGEWVKKQVNLLSRISGQALKGEVTAILGPSGAGKSTFLDALAGRIARGSLQGTVSLDGQQITASQMKRISAYVMQEDRLFPMLTVLETFIFAAEVRLPPSMSKSHKRERVYQLLQQLGLQTATHTCIGDEGTRGVSGGERRRVSIGVDIIHKPPLLFLDEPTSGLDSTSAFTVVERVKDIAKEGSIVIMTIHQPSYRIQELLNTMVILARGRLIYRGPPRDLGAYLGEFGREVPEGETDIEYLLDMIKEYEDSTVGLDPLVHYQMYGIRPTDAMKTPIRRASVERTPLIKGSGSQSGNREARSIAASPYGAIVKVDDPVLSRNMADNYNDDEVEDDDFDNSLVRQTPFNNFRNPRLASSFYKNFSVWLYNEVVDSVRGTPGPPTWAPPPSETPGRTFMVNTMTPGRTPMASTMTPASRTPMANTMTPGRTPMGPTPRQFHTTPTMSDVPSDDDSQQSLTLAYGPKFANPWLREVRVLMWRNFLNIYRTPELFLSREIVFIVMGIMLSTLFKHLNKEFQPSTANSLLNFFIFAVCLLFFSSNDAVPAFIQERYIYIRETSYNAYRASSYTIAHLLIFLPFFAIQAFTFTALTFFFLKLHGDWWVYWGILYACLITTNSFVVFISAVVPNYITGYAVVIAATAVFFLNCGFFLKKSKIPNYWIWLHYMSTIKYPFEALLINQFDRNDGFCYSLHDVPAVGVLGHIVQANGSFSRDNDTCYAIGEDILETMDIGQKSIAIDVLILLGWGVFYRFLFYVILRFYSKNQRK